MNEGSMGTNGVGRGDEGEIEYAFFRRKKPVCVSICSVFLVVLFVFLYYAFQCSLL